MKYPAFVCLFFIVICGYGVPGQNVPQGSAKNNQLTSDYEKWIAPFRDHAWGRVWINSSEEDKRIKLVLTVVTDNDPPSGSKDLFSFNYGRFSYGSVVSTDGQVNSFRNGLMGSSGGCCSQIQKSELEQIDYLVSNLPSDHGVLPPNDRRVVIQIPVADKFEARVFDLANVPDLVSELLRLTKSHIGTRVLRRDADMAWATGEERDMQGFATTPDGRQLISSNSSGPMKIWDMESHIRTRDVSLPQNVFLQDLIFSPDNSTLIGSGWGTIIFYDTRDWQVIKLVEEPYINRKTIGFFKPQFINNGKYLLFETDSLGLRIYETKTWKTVSSLQQIPAGAVSYYPTAGGSRAVYAMSNGHIVLCNAGQTATLVQLDKDKLEYVSFSPDDTKVVIVTSGLDHEGDSTWIKFRTRMWDSATGEFLKELRPFEQNFCESVDGVQWSPDGRFFMAAAADNPTSIRNIVIWDVKSGRHRAELGGCVGKITGIRILASQNKLVEGCADNVIRVWNLEKVIDEINRFSVN